MLKEHFVMLQGSIKHFHSTGTICSSSPWAAKALVEPVIQTAKPIRILEIGAGTGPVTVEIIKHLKSEDHLTVVEMNNLFMTTLKEAVTKVPEYQNCSERIEFFEGPIQDLTEKYQFDIIICALPFLNFGKELTESILAKINRLAAKNSVMTHFEYIALGHLGSAFSKKRKEQFQELRTIFNVSKSTSNISRKKVWRNLFPIYVYTTALPLKFESSISDSAANTVLSH